MSSHWETRPTLVTGASGLLGGWLVEELVARGADVVCIVRDWVPQSRLHDPALTGKVKIVRGDVCDQAFVERVLGEYEINTVFHLAAQTIVSIANRNPLSTFESNIAGTWVMLEAARRSPTVKSFVFASSDKAYGTHDKLPYGEDTPLQGRHPYDVSKSCADLIAQSYAYSYATPVVIARCGNLFGGGDLNWNRIVPGTIRSAIRGERPVIRSDGKMTRDYLYVRDGVSAYIALAEAIVQRPALAGHGFNFGHDNPVSVLDMASHILRVAGRTDLTPDVRNEVKNEIPAQYLDPSKARRELGWQPAYSLDAGLAETIAWYQQLLGAS